MRTLNVRVNFFWDDGDDMEAFMLIVPDNIDDNDVFNILQKEHKYLSEEDEDDLYGIRGRNPHTLIEYICQKYGWKSNDFSFDIDVNMD